MRKIRYTLDIGYAGCDDEGEMEVDDFMSDAQISMMVDEMANEHAASWEGDTRLGWHEEMTEEEKEEESETFWQGIDGSWEFIEDDDDA